MGANVIKGFHPPTVCANGMVATPHYLATLTGVRVLMDGGNAVDAAVAANAVLGVVEPHMCGVGGDLFALVYLPRRGVLLGLNASGRAPRALTVDRLRSLGYERMPRHGALAATVPGAVDGWTELLARAGTRGLDELLQPAIELAERGAPVTRRLAERLASSEPLLRQFPSTADAFLPGGRVPREGDLLRLPELAATLRLLASDGRDAFYRGPIAQAIAETSARLGGAITAHDLADHRSEWVEPLSTTYRGYDVYQLPPNSQGLTVLLELNLAEGFDLAAWPHNSAEVIHTLVEIKKLAFADRDRYLGDPSFVEVPIAPLLDKEYAARRRRLVDPQRAAEDAGAGRLASGDTVYLCAADRDGNIVSLIQSLYYAFGSGVVVEGTGILLHNRGAYFTFEEGHPNRLQPGKRPLHTLTPGLVGRGGRPFMAIGTRGGDGQPQTVLQVLVNMLDYGLDPQAAVAAPRWIHGGVTLDDERDTLTVEEDVPAEVREELVRRGHRLAVVPSMSASMGSAMVVRVDEERGVFWGAADPRSHGLALGW
ncbi:MAG TPA: gamma-glutamyltransferase [Chloroflexota bacterium]